MKKIVFWIATVHFSVAFAQVQLCVNKSTTIPYIGANQDVLKDWKINKFDWMNIPQNKIYIDKNSYNASQAPTHVNDPFRPVAAKNYRWPMIGDSDIKIGWELIKQDLGYFNNDNKNIASKMKDNGNAVGLPIPYIILYNKYRGTLRVMGFVITDSKNFVKVSLTFNNRLPNLIDEKAVGNGILRQYEKSGETALDKPTTVVDNVSQFAINPNYLSSQELFFADFQLSYDPCICQFYSGLVIKFEGVEQATLNAFSKTVDINQARNNPDVLASVFDDGNGNVQGGIASFKSLDALKTQMGAIAGSNSAYDSETQTFIPKIANLAADVNKGIKVYKDLYGNVGDALSVFNQDIKKFEIGTGVLKLVKDAGKIFGAIGAVTDVISIFMGGETKAIANPSISAISGTVTKISTGLSLALATPGSKTSNDDMTFSFEYASRQADFNEDGNRNTANSNWYSKSVRPMYNEIPGVYAMLKTPSVRYYIHDFPTNIALFGRTLSNNVVSIKLPNNNDNIQFTLNPSLSIVGYTFKYALQIRVRGGIDSRVDRYDAIKGTNGLKQTYRYGNGDYMLMTSYMSYQELSSFTPLVTILGIHENVQVESINLKVSGIIIFNELNADGENNSQIFSRTFDLTTTKNPPVIVPYPSQLSRIDYGCIKDYSNVTVELDISTPNIITTETQCLFPNPLNVYAKDKIIINTKETVSGQLNFYAPEISVEGETNLEGEVVLDSKISIFGRELPPDPLPIEMDNAFYNTYCSVSNNALSYKAYQTNINARLEEQATTAPPTPISHPISSPKLTITPNPTSGQVTFYYTLPTDGHVSLSISNIMGVKVLEVIPNQTMPSGVYQKTIDASTLPAGVYLVSIQTDGGKIVERMVVME